MELVDGLPFDRHINRSSAREAALRHALSQLADGVSALHAGGFLHRDLKPSNVLVTADGRVVVVDFGLVRELHPLESQDTLSIVGTPAYMAPEQFSLEAMTESADWYAVGVMLYEALTGRLPFEGTPLELFAKKQSRDVIPPSQLLGEVPADLEEICLGLLQRDPSRRLSGADLRKRLDVPGGAPGISEPQAHIPAMPGIEFVGRTRELAAAHDAFVNTRVGQAQLVHVSGVSGIGKTAFVRQLIDRIKNVSPDVVVLPGRCHPTESVPYQGIDQVIDGLARHLRRIGRNEAEKVLPRDFAMLVRLFPVLEPLNASAPARMRDVADPTEFRNRVFLALREMLGRLAERHPVVIVIDDLQWADLDALAALRELAAPPAAPSLLLVLAYRSDDAAWASPLRQFVDLTTSGNGYPEAHLITLQGLDDWDATQTGRGAGTGGDPARPRPCLRYRRRVGWKPVLCPRARPGARAGRLCRLRLPWRSLDGTRGRTPARHPVGGGTRVPGARLRCGQANPCQRGRRGGCGPIVPALARQSGRQTTPTHNRRSGRRYRRDLSRQDPRGHRLVLVGRADPSLSRATGRGARPRGE